MGHFQKLSSIGACALILSGLSGCTYIIPPDPSTPRYNALMGERRAPMRNRMDRVPQQGSSLTSPTQETPFAATAPIMPAPVPEVVVNNLPPISPAAPVAVANAMPELPPVDAATRAAAERIDPSIRQIPTENSAYAVAENSFSSVPTYAMPVGSDAPAARLNNVRRDLETERARADVARDALASDAAAEPSLLPLPETRRPAGNVPVTQPVIPQTPAPVVTSPAPQTYLAPQYTPTPVTQPVAPAPAPQIAYTQPQPGYIALPPPPPLMGAPEARPVAVAPAAPQPTAMSPTTVAVAASPAPVAMVNANPSPRSFDPMAVAAANPSLPPIQLRAPGSFPQTTVVAQAEPVTIAVTSPQPSSLSSFNPMAAPTAASAHGGYAGEGFIAPSRYAARR